MAVERNPRGKKSGNNHTEYEQISINNAQYTRSRGTRSSRVSPSENHSMLRPSLKLESEKTRRVTKEVASRRLKTSRIRRTSSTSSSAETEDSPPRARRS
jgi:hypothetical protein